MGLFPEKEPVKNVIERPDEASPLSIERKEVATPVPTQFKAQVTDDNGKQVLTTPQSQKIDISIPAGSKEELEEKAKTDTEKTPAWNASFLLRIIKKAIFFGKNILFKGKNVT